MSRAPRQAPNAPLRIIFAGTPEFAAIHLQALIDSKHTLIAVYTQPDRPAGRGKKLQASPVKHLAESNRIEVFQPVSLRDPGEQQILAGLDADVLVVVAYGLILPQAVLDAPRLGCLNVHASLLPRWRGAAPIERALMAGDVETGVTIMRTEAELDAGPIVAVERFAVGPDEDAGDVERRALEVGVPALAHALAAAQACTLDWVPQPADGVTYAAKLERADRLVDPLSDGALETANRVRALRPRIGALLDLDGETTVIWRVTATQEPLAPGQVRVVDGALAIGLWGGSLCVEELQSPGKRALPAADWLRGRRAPPVACTKPA